MGPSGTEWVTGVDVKELVMACPRVETLRFSGATNLAFDLSAASARVIPAVLAMREVR
jgi:hypothetical protein